MAKGLNVSEAGQRLGEAGFANSARYARGTQGKGGRWVGSASQAEANFKTGMAEFLAKGSLSRSMSEAGAASYDAGVQAKGIQNWGPGMNLGRAKYEKNVQKFASLWNAPLSTPRGAKRSPQNANRMTENMNRFIAAKGK